MLEFEVLDLPTTHAFHIARSGSPVTRRSVSVQIHDDEGLVGHGEAAPIPYYGETIETVTAVLPLYAARLEELIRGPDGVVWTELERIEDTLEDEVGRNPAARAALSGALHDLFAKRLDEPLWRVWGLSPEAAPRSSFTLGLDELSVMREKLREAASYPILKVKVGTPQDEEVLALIREEAPEKTVRVDANTAWSATEAIARLPLLEEYGVELIEQPVAANDLEGLARVRSHSTIPIIADESCTTASDIPHLASVVDGINIKLAKCGSMREAMKMVHVARAHGLGIMLGCMIESTLGIAAALQLAPLVDWVDLDGAALLAEDPFTGPGLEPDGRLRFNTTPGLGVERVCW